VRLLLIAVIFATMLGASCSTALVPPRPADPGSPTHVWDFEGPGSGLAGWDVLQPTELRNGQTRVVKPTAYGVPARRGGTNAHVLRASVNSRQRSAGAYAAYLYKVWAVAPPETGWTGHFGKPFEQIRRGEEGGTYRAWYFLPRSTRRILRHNNHGRYGWVNIFQFKHSNPDGGGPGRWAQPPEWWVNIRNNNPDRLALCVSHWGRPNFCERRGLAGSHLPRVPFGRWFELRADVHPGERIDFYLDGRLFETGRQAHYGVGLAPGDSSWIFSPGWYLNTGTAYIDDVSFHRAPAGW
jgi:hypothetical protein